MSSAHPRPELLEEATDWIAEQMADEGMLVSGGLIDLVLSHEWEAIGAGADPNARPALVEAISGRLSDEGVLVAPPPSTLSTDGVDASQVRPVPPQIVEQVLSWEDEFLGLAGISRDATKTADA